MRKFVLASAFTSTVAFTQDFKAFGGVWFGPTNYQEGGQAFNVGSFFLARVPLMGKLQGLHFGYAVSASTSVRVVSDSGIDPVTGNFITVNAAGIGNHVPFEANAAYVIGFGRLRGWAGDGVNISLAQATATFTVSDLSSGNTCSADATGQTGFSQGFQIFGGGEYVFGSLPRIGGKWGIFFMAKYLYAGKFKMKITGEVQCVDSTGTAVSQRMDESIDLNLSNTSFVAGLTYHF